MVRRGQAAMEFLMTYGWAILVVLAAIGALAYFGVLSPDNFLPNKCTISPEFACVESKVNTDGSIQLGIQNNVGNTLSEVNVTFSSQDCTLSNSTFGETGVSNGHRLDSANDGLIVFNCDSALTQNDKFQGDLSIRYVLSGQTVDHTVTGSLQRKVE